jgi:hypothetical protein
MKKVKTESEEMRTSICFIDDKHNRVINAVLLCNNVSKMMRNGINVEKNSEILSRFRHQHTALNV